MRVGFNLLYLIPNEVGGTETYVRNLLEWIQRIDIETEYVVFTNRENHQTFSFESQRFRKVLCDVSARRKILRILWEQILFPGVVKRERLDVLFSPGYVIPVLIDRGNIVVVHDALYRRFPNLVSLGKRMYWSMFVPLSVRKSRAVITDSDFSKSELRHFFPFASEKIFSVTLGVENGKVPARSETAEILKRLAVEGTYVLCVSTLSPHKNLGRLLGAFKAVRGKMPDVQLVLAGKFERAAGSLRRDVRALGLEGCVKILGYVDKHELECLYAAARLFVLPSLMEGFGFPVLEAMRAGCPVACSRTAALPEVGGNAARYFDPHNVDEMASVMEQLLYDEGLRNLCIERGKENVLRFSWERCARETILLIQNAQR